ncbi:MAG: hypothetical protein A2Y88_00100 [Chloroflexi bacterium RBG_13_48_10]|nr:MAG: hypothetical protein A2Y88_00100 [Chloroflexi bacterium RBG_13_48_10]
MIRIIIFSLFALTRHTTYIDTINAYEFSPSGRMEAAEWMPRDGYLAANQLLDRGAYFTELVISNDYLALGAILTLIERGLHNPEDISIVGFGDAPAHRKAKYVVIDSILVR